jgi:hypothetical protein
VQLRLAPIAVWVVFSIVAGARSFLPGELSFSQVAFAAQTKAPSSQGAAAKKPPVIADETSVQALADLKDSLTALKAAVQEQGRHIKELIERQEQQAHALATLRNDVEKFLSLAMTVALAVALIISLTIIGVLLLQLSHTHPSPSVPSVEQAVEDIVPVALPKASPQECPHVERHIATRYLSTPKEEDVIVTDVAPHRSVIVLADGATSIRCKGGELSGGGRQAAQIAARAALTYLTDHLRPCLALHELLATLHACFSEAQSALEQHNTTATTPGGTTLLIALLCPAGDGRWYWLYGNLGNGVLLLLHSTQLLAGLPIHTPLLTKQSNGGTTITLPAHASTGYLPSIGVRPHRPGDLLLIGSDGLDNLNKVTKKDSYDFHNYLWTQIHDGRSHLDDCLQSLQTGRQDTQWQNALAQDDTTIGILWA